MADQRVEVDVVGRVQRDADTGRDHDLLLVDNEGFVERVEHALRHVGRVLGTADVLDDDGELVATQARQRVRLGALVRHRIDVAQALRERTPHMLEQAVADLVPEIVVDHLEAVEVEEHQGHHLAAALRARHRLAQPVAEQRAVGQAGEAVVVGHVAQLLLRIGALGAVEHAHDHLLAGRGPELRQVQLHRARVVGPRDRVAVAQREMSARLALHQQFDHRSADRALVLDTEQLGGHCVARAHQSVGATDQQAIAGTVEQRVEQRVACRGREVFGAAEPAPHGRQATALLGGRNSGWQTIGQAATLL